MKFSKVEKAARDVVLAAEGEVSLEDIWDGIGNRRTQFWRTKASDLMLRVCLKSLAIGPEIVRSTPLGRGAKARYAVKCRKEVL